jgi:ABC-type Fe3+/spermidine/putrescine transport system ATPase subunit
MRDVAQGNPIVFDEVRKSFGPVPALLPTSLEVGAGEFLTLLGPSGSGKTTLLNIAAGYISPDSGRVRLGGRDVTDLPPRQRNIGMVFQNYALFPHLDVFDNVAYGLKVRRRPAAEIRQRVLSALAMVRLDGLENRQIEPDVLLMDEPLGALDRQLRKHVQLELRRLHTQSRRTTIYVTHDQEEALVLSDRIAVMSEGRLEQVGTPAELYRSPKNVFVATFLGESNLLQVRIGERTARDVSFCVDGVAHEWRIPVPSALPQRNVALLLVRPEDFRLASEGEPGLDAEIAETVYLGELTALRLKLETGQSVWMRQMKLPPLRVGERMRVRWDPTSVRLLDDVGQTAQSGGSNP